MPEVIKFSKGTVAEHNNFTGENGEITLICDDSPNRKVTGIIRLHDGQTVGGIPFGGSQLLNDMHDVNAANTIANQILTVNANGEFYFANTVETIADGTISGDKIFGGTITTNGAVISGSSTEDLVRITQTGTGNALVVEDSSSDSSPFVVNAIGNVGVGTSIPSVKLQVSGTNQTDIVKLGTGGTHLTINTNDTIGEVQLKAQDDSGNNYWKFITFHTEGGSGVTERMRIDSSGNVIINENGNDSDFRVESVNNANMLKVDALEDVVIIGSSGTSSPKQPGLKVGSAWTYNSYIFGSGSSRTVTFSADFTYAIEVTLTIIPNSGGIGQSRFIAGRRDWTGASHFHSVADLINTTAEISVSTSDSGNTRTYTLTLDHSSDGANLNYVVEVKSFNLDSLTVG